MTTYYFTTNQSSLNTDTGDTVYEAQGVVISGDIDMRNDTANDGNGGGQENIFLNGGLLGSLYDYYTNNSGVDQITIGQSGYVSYNYFGAIELGGGGNTVTNDGVISASNYADDIYIVGSVGADQSSADTIINTGTISGTETIGRSGDAVVDLLSVSSFDLVNSGSILAGNGALSLSASTTAAGSSLFNSGLMAGVVDIVGESAFVDNEGTISGNVSDTASGSSLRDGGTIVGDVTLGDTATITVDQGGSVKGDLTAGSAHLANYGVIDGDVTLSGSVRNTGSIEGNVTLGTGNDTFNGRGGSVAGVISGGSGSDIIRAGNDGEFINGGAGHDTIFAGTGPDTFMFSPVAADSDTVKGFNATQDTIQLSHTAFTALQVDKAPVFTIGTAASSGADHLFYNATTGGLFYDVDGSGSAHAAVEIANLGPHLKLTAGNFHVT